MLGNLISLLLKAYNLCNFQNAAFDSCLIPTAAAKQDVVDNVNLLLMAAVALRGETRATEGRHKKFRELLINQLRQDILYTENVLE